ncbi:hypothetical protein TWF694_009574 [Orbilia ellipsospora]|uniref:Ankyrin repeat protein n=1 Tax=Orbilia ellipsospora TaxID=2528407 RepID=A0AAV9XHM9_9PEZI
MNANLKNISQLAMNSTQSQKPLMTGIDSTQDMIQQGFQQQYGTSNRLLAAMDKLSLELDVKFSKSQDMIITQGSRSQQLMSMMGDLMVMMKQIQATSGQTSLAQYQRANTGAMTFAGSSFNNAADSPVPQLHNAPGATILSDFYSVANNMNRLLRSGRRSLFGMSTEAGDTFRLFDKAVQVVLSNIPQILDYPTMVSLKKKEVISDVEYMDWEEQLESIREVERVQNIFRRSATAGNIKLARGQVPSFDNIKSTEFEFQGLSIIVSISRKNRRAPSSKGLYASGSYTDSCDEGDVVTAAVELASLSDLLNPTGYSKPQVSIMVTESIARYGSLLEVPYLRIRNRRPLDKTTNHMLRAVRTGDISTLSKMFAYGLASPCDVFEGPNLPIPCTLLECAEDPQMLRFLLQSGADFETRPVIHTCLIRYPQEFIEVLEEFNFYSWLQFIEDNACRLFGNIDSVSNRMTT